jgi:hypothetical protein
MSQDYKGVAVVTGASSGIGAIYADRLARRGYDLILIARSQDKLHTIAGRITNDTGRAVEVVVADLGKPADLARVEVQLSQDASVTLLVNNAGFGTFAPLLRSDVAKMGEMIQLNVLALMRLTYAVAPGMARRGQGAIINISSMVSIAPEALNGVYGGTKAFVHAFTTSLNHELGPQGIRVQAVLPGATATDFWATGGLPIENLPSGITMRADDMVDAALAGFDQGEVVTIPALPDIAQWNAFESARLAMAPNLSRSTPAARYGAV